MKKLFFFAAIAAAALSSCSSDELVQGQAPEVEDGAVRFGVYSGRNTRATELSTDKLGVLGFGVFAFEQGTAQWTTYSASNSYPNFFYNQKVDQTAGFTGVTLKSSITKAAYDALDATYRAYYTVNPSDANEYTTSSAAPSITTVDAYKALTDAQRNVLEATFTASTPWAYSPVKYFSNNKNALHSFFAYAPYQSNPKTVFDLANNGPAIRYNAADNYDLLWGQEKDQTYAPVNKPKANVTDGEIKFMFKHALSKVNVEVCYFNDAVHSGHTQGEDLLDEHTTISVRSVKFIGNVPSQGLLSLYDGSWTFETTEESAYEITTPVTFELPDKANEYKTLKSDMMVLPTLSTNEADKVSIQIVYDVITKDATNPKNNSKITNTITSKEKFAFVAGNAYNFKLDLGLTSVKFNATVGTWTPTTDDTQVDLPNNH